MAEAEEAASGYPFREIFACAAIWAAASYLNALFGYAIPGIIAEYDVPVFNIGLVLSASFAFAALTCVVVGSLADHVGHRPVIVACLTASAVLTGMMGWAGPFLLLAALRMTGNGFGTALAPVTGGYVSNRLPPHRRPLAIAIVQSGFPVGWFLAAIIVAPLIEDNGWRTLYLSSFVVALVAPLAWWALPPSGHTAQDRQDAPAQRPRQRVGPRMIYNGHLRKPALLVAIGFFCYAGAYGSSAFYMPAFLQAVRGYDAATATLLTGCSYGVGIAGYLGAALAGQSGLGRRRAAMIWCVCGAICFSAFVWLPRTLWQDFLAFGLTAFFFYGTGAVLFAVASEVFPSHVRTAGLAASASLGVNMGFAVAPSLGGVLIEVLGWQFAFTVSALPLLAVTIGCLYLLRNHAEEGEEIATMPGGIAEGAKA